MSINTSLSDHLIATRDRFKAHICRGLKLSSRDVAELALRFSTLAELAKDMEEDLRIHQDAVLARQNELRSKKAQADLARIIDAPDSNVKRLRAGLRQVQHSGPSGGDAA